MADTENPKAKLLLVDDDLPTRLLLGRVLRKQGYDILEAANGLQAIETVKTNRPDLVLMDVMMPELDGYGACAQIRQLDGDESLPIVMLTGAEDIDAIEQAFTSGATDFITKPINWPLLIQRVKYALRTGALNREVRQNRLREASVRKIAGLGFWDWAIESDRLQWTDELEALTGVGPDEIGSLDDFVAKVHPDDQARLRSTFDLVRQSGGRIELDLRLQAPREERLIRLMGERGAQREDAHRVYGAYQDVTAIRKAESLVDYLAFHDELTGLANRRLFIRLMRSAMERVRSQQQNVLLIGWIDLVRFHRHNDELGEGGADVLLTMMAQRLKSVSGGGAEVARVGGDEFVVMWTMPRSDEVTNRFEAMLESLRYPFKVNGIEAFVTVSAGISLFPDHGVDAPEQLLAKAQEAQRVARAQGTEYVLAAADQDANQSLFAALSLERELRRAVDNGEFFLVYQPQMAFREGEIVGAEALLRWRHPERGVVPPVQFIPVLEEMGLISVVGQWVLQESCRQAAEWAQAGLSLRIGVNLSPRQFLDSKLFSLVHGIALQAGVSPSLIELEITESLAMQDMDHSIGMLEKLREVGFQVAIDDFGIGHSSLEYLLRFPLDAIKIDRAFITHITTRNADRAIVRAITSIAQTLNLKVIAEGVEDQRQSDFIEALGVSEVQGYLIGKPMMAAELEALARSYSLPGG
jgi:diguanylate cyclase (GGDEF)-like protein